VVPPGTEAAPGLAAGEALKRAILIAHDGSLACMRTLHVFALLGLGRNQVVKLLDFAPETSPEALQRYLTQHEMRAEAYAVTGDAHDILLAEAQSLPASLLVLGADQESGITRLIFGSATARLLRAAPCPVFIHG
jgi:nucleotide-binding universal stress UspA family protein